MAAKVPALVIDARQEWMDLSVADDEMDSEEQMRNWEWFQVQHPGYRSPETKRRPSPANPPPAKVKPGKLSDEDVLKQMLKEHNDKVKHARSSASSSSSSLDGRSSKRHSSQMARRPVKHSSIPEHDEVECSWAPASAMASVAAPAYTVGDSSSQVKRRKPSTSPPSSPRTNSLTRSVSDASSAKRPQRIRQPDAVDKAKEPRRASSMATSSQRQLEQDERELQELFKQHNRKLHKTKPSAHPHQKLVQLFEKVENTKYYELGPRERERCQDIIHNWILAWETKAKREYYELSVPERDVAHHKIHMMVLQRKPSLPT
ncbi:hypothetical protein SDRG_10568 [Saprolegnia diclina VS20]|uniref:Uncharacterized protein n=1 Tax=Saprolegnia diclina (strain VS20) TaxID=1156394 RepID=T0Q1Q4_SAPDV|nr:hypothetical protein SDRG_10568 [Saprolegnia diclina VS20]EQC31779.1 hypothetical protein SDRG_10568 [Saprolegnia diclina VS20]|eukprot:XP_008614786.1 hypothetical protein SDRG_10568 [Saprolegnia diclina VS20]